MNNSQELPLTVQDIVNGDFRHKLILWNKENYAEVMEDLLNQLKRQYFSGEADMGYNLINDEEKQNIIDFVKTLDLKTRCLVFGSMQLTLIGCKNNAAESGHPLHSIIISGYRFLMDQITDEESECIVSLLKESLKKRDTNEILDYLVKKNSNESN